MNENVWPLILLGGGLLAFLLVVSFLSKNYSLNNFKNKTVGDGQHFFFIFSSFDNCLSSWVNSIIFNFSGISCSSVASKTRRME